MNDANKITLPPPPDTSCHAVSVIIPMYNVEKYIGECLDSLLAQTFQNFEVIIVDDCSTDNSVVIVESYVPKFNGRLILAKMAKNTGSGAVPRNEGLKLSRGEYIQFLDADDMLTKTALKEMYTLAKEYKSDVVYCEKYYYADEDGSNIREHTYQKGTFVDKPTFEPEDLTERVQAILNDRYLTVPWNKLVRRKLITRNNIYFPITKISEDNIWNQGLLFCAKKFLRVPNIVYVYRQNKSSVMRKERTPQQKINFWLNPVLLGLKALDKLMNKNKFFKENPSYRFALLKKFVTARFSWTSKSAEQLTEYVIYSTIKDEFGKILGKYDVLIPALCATLYSERKAHKEETQALRKVIDNFTARIDIKLVPKTDGGDFQIFSVSDDKAKLTKPDWFNKGGIGYVLTSYAGKIDFVAKATADGKMNLNLRGIDRRDPNDKSKFIPYWIDYTKLSVNGKVILDKLTPAWHNKPYRYALDVKAEEEIKIEVEWLPHRSDT